MVLPPTALKFEMAMGDSLSLTADVTVCTEVRPDGAPDVAETRAAHAAASTCGEGAGAGDAALSVAGAGSARFVSSECCARGMGI